MSTPDLWTTGVKVLLKAVIRERGFTQLKVQAELGWGRSYISQALNGSKALRFDVVLKILFVVGMEPTEFFARLSRQVNPEPPSEERAEAGGRLPSEDLCQLAELKQGLIVVARFLVDHHGLPANDVGALLDRKSATAGGRKAGTE